MHFIYHPCFLIDRNCCFFYNFANLNPLPTHPHPQEIDADKNGNLDLKELETFLTNVNADAEALRIILSNRMQCKSDVQRITNLFNENVNPNTKRLPLADIRKIWEQLGDHGAKPFSNTSLKKWELATIESLARNVDFVCDGDVGVSLDELRAINSSNPLYVIVSERME